MSPDPGAGKVRQSRLMSQAGRVHDVVCAYVSVFMHSDEGASIPPLT